MKTEKLKPEKPVTGSKGGAKGQKAVLTAKYAKYAKRRQHELDRQDACPTTQRRKLAGILERFDISVQSFNALRADSYEKHLARRSLADLEAFYGVLLGSCRGYREMARECPTWGEDNKPPHCTTLCSIKQRILAEQTVADLEGKLKQLDAVQARISGLPAETQALLLNGMVTYLSQELLNAKFDGQPIMENLKVMDRLLKAGSLRVRERREARAEARLEWERAGKPIKNSNDEFRMTNGTGVAPANVTLDPNNKNKATLDSNAAEEEPYDPVAEKAKVRAMIDKMYGLSDDAEEAASVGPEPSKTDPMNN